MNRTHPQKDVRKKGALTEANKKALERLPEKVQRALSDAGITPKHIAQIYKEEALLRPRCRAGTPYGMCWEGQSLIEDKEEHHNVLTIVALHEAGESFGAICRHLEANGIEARGVTWYRGSIKRIVERHRANQGG